LTELPSGGGDVMGRGRGRGRGVPSMINVFNRMNNCDRGLIVVRPLLFSLVRCWEVQGEENNSGGSNIVVVGSTGRGRGCGNAALISTSTPG
jgi:hypothetical protein